MQDYESEQEIARLGKLLDDMTAQLAAAREEVAELKRQLAEKCEVIRLAHCKLGEVGFPRSSPEYGPRLVPRIQMLLDELERRDVVINQMVQGLDELERVACHGIDGMVAIVRKHCLAPTEPEKKEE